ncbi:MAG: 4Fe-4S binding protein, partial [Candidatus Bathyarchaeia archaeon]
LGRGMEHAKWQPTSVCSYKYIPKISLDQKKCDGCGECVRYCPHGVLGVENGKIVVKNEMSCTLCQECVRHCDAKGAPLKIEWDPDSFIFTIESTRSLSPKEILLEALKILRVKIAQISDLVTEGGG